MYIWYAAQMNRSNEDDNSRPTAKFAIQDWKNDAAIITILMT